MALRQTPAGLRIGVALCRQHRLSGGRIGQLSDPCRSGMERAPPCRLEWALAGILLVPGLATLWTAWHKFLIPVPPAPVPLSLAGAGALAVNLSCALMLTRYRHHAGSLTRAAFLSACNDALANVAIVGAGVTTIYVRSAWPDLIVGLGIAVMNADAAREVYTTARAEQRTAVP